MLASIYFEHGLMFTKYVSQVAKCYYYLFFKSISFISARFYFCGAASDLIPVQALKAHVAVHTCRSRL